MANEKVIGDILKGLSEIVVPEKKEPSIRSSALKEFASTIAKEGYQFSEEMLNALIYYMKGYNICLLGNVGVGKTFFFDCINSVRRKRGSDGIVKLSMIETQGWTMKDAVDWAHYTVGYDVLIDDVGAEPAISHYGQKLELFPYLLEKRMGVFGRRTHVTSNLGGADILKRYERRVGDRMAQMFKIVQLKAKKSRRKSAAWNPPSEGSVAQ